MKNNSLVIGGGGFVGKSLVKILVNSGKNVIILGRSSCNDFMNFKNVKYIQASFHSKSIIDSLLDQSSEVIHLANATVPNTSFNDHLKDLNHNLPATLQLFSLAAKKNVKLILLSSGGTVYGNSKLKIITEKHQTRPISTYGITKLTIEKYAYLYSVTHGLKYICLRPSNAYGEGQKAFTGQGFISTAIESIIRNKPVVIYGKFGTVRDYIYIDDLAYGIYSAITKGKYGETYNISSGLGFSNIEVINLLKPIMQAKGYEVKVMHDQDRVYDVRRNILNSKKLFIHTGWSPKVNFKEGLEIVSSWYIEKYKNV